MHTPYNGTVQPLASELHHHTLPHLHHIVVLLRHTIGIGVVDMQR